MVVTNRLRGVPLTHVRSDPVRLFEVLSSVGEIQSIDFSHIQTESLLMVTYFDSRAAKSAIMTLKADYFEVF